GPAHRRRRAGRRRRGLRAGPLRLRLRPRGHGGLGVVAGPGAGRPAGGVRLARRPAPVHPLRPARFRRAPRLADRRGRCRRRADRRLAAAAHRPAAIQAGRGRAAGGVVPRHAVRTRPAARRPGRLLGRCRRRVGRRRHGRLGRVDRPRADTLGHAAGLGPRRAAGRVPGVQPRHARPDDGGLPRERHHLLGGRAALPRGRSGHAGPHADRRPALPSFQRRGVPELGPRAAGRVGRRPGRHDAAEAPL
ncbi:MAG: Putative inner membrane protein, partial [uncultured Acetobacteraceae bacterium]